MAFAISNPIGTGTDQELLDFTRAAIAQITLHGQAYTIDGRELTRADLRSLREQVTWLESRINSAAGNQANNIARLQRPA
jgi:ABC-type protease/lipase transport system fused ATPase/permease subunit